MRTIGILGGMGPRVTVMFEQLLLDRLSGGDQQVPTIITINDGSIPDRSQFLLGMGTDPVPQLQKNLDRLMLMGAEIIAVPCNSASMSPIFNRLESREMLLNLPELVVAEVEAKGIKRVCLLATEGAISSGDYQRLCEEVGIECVVLPISLRNKVSNIIGAVKSGEVTRARMGAGKVASELEKMNIEAVILGCTELPLVEDQLVPTGIESINSLAVLADACVKYSKGENRAKRFIYA